MTMFRIGVILLIFLAAVVFLIYGILDPMAARCHASARLDDSIVCPRYVDLTLTLLLVVSALITLFGTLSIEGARNADGSFREQRIRLSIAISVLVTYLVYFSLAIFGPRVLTTRSYSKH